GYTGGELIRLLLFHPSIELVSITSESNAGKPIYFVHPNLRNVTDLVFVSMDTVEPCDVLFLSLPHGKSKEKFDQFRKLAKVVIDLSQDFRLDSRFVYGLAEIYRDKLKTANYIAGAGCNATATILALYPFYKHKLVFEDRTVVEAKIGSSAAGNKPTLSSHHPERSGVVRSYRPTGHRHIAEICTYLHTKNIHFSATTIEMVRGILITAHVFLKQTMSEKDVWNLYRDIYSNEPFIRMVKQKSGIHRFPEPKYVMGTNYCDIGFELDEESNRVVIMAAIDNLVKGAAGQVIQAFNIRHGFDEKTGLEFPGLHPV
ncbi:N-acetyl-gamma-glutamyl-phosphate reductase, partial [Patescibacteria group bacterium AH-259-L07]|nr:N-acetyl-gamma-glutamyl-phosphate reductase [Patescibacteria group bacterium AH-259-L07]